MLKTCSAPAANTPGVELEGAYDHANHVPQPPHVDSWCRSVSGVGLGSFQDLLPVGEGCSCRLVRAFYGRWLPLSVTPSPNTCLRLRCRPIDCPWQSTFVFGNSVHAAVNHRLPSAIDVCLCQAALASNNRCLSLSTSACLWRSVLFVVDLPLSFGNCAVLRLLFGIF